jgi:hypothetical protein
MRGSYSVDSQFIPGIVTGLLLVAGVAGLDRAVSWLSTQPQPQALVEFLLLPRFSLWDVLSGILMLVVLYLLVYVAAYGPTRI